MKQLNSGATGRSYDIYVRLPDEYTQDQAKHYPVLYVLDAQWDFKMLDSIYGGFLHDGFIPEIIIVGITYSGDDADIVALRSMDYTSVHNVFIKGSGEAPKFLTFLEEQLIPFIEEEFTQTLGKRNYPSLEGEGHASNKPEAYNRGLRYIFQK